MIGEPEFEIGAALRNPYARPELFTAPLRIARRVDRFARALDLDVTRTLAWAFAQAVLAVVWTLEDGSAIEPGHPWLALASAIQPMLQGVI